MTDDHGSRQAMGRALLRALRGPDVPAQPAPSAGPEREGQRGQDVLDALHDHKQRHQQHNPFPAARAA
jgi:hypothetical protein